MYQGCPHRCIFCNVHQIAGSNSGRITEQTFRETVNRYLSHAKRKAGRVQIAFYGGNFTGMDKDHQAELLGFAGQFIKTGEVYDVRVSTRPDHIDDVRLDLLKSFHVTTVEIGAQSFIDEVLARSGRGHDSADVIKALKLLKERGFKTGVHLMAGLPGDSRAGFEYTVAQTVLLKPDMVRIHPTLVFQNTGLAELFLNGAYAPLGMSEAIDMCKYALRRFAEAGIPVIRVGLQTTEEMETAGGIIAGPYHPAFRTLVEESIFFDTASSLLMAGKVRNREVIFSLAPGDVSSFRGHRNKNIRTLKELYNLNGINVYADPARERGALSMKVEGAKE